MIEKMAHLTDEQIKEHLYNAAITAEEASKNLGVSDATLARECLSRGIQGRREVGIKTIPKIKKAICPRGCKWRDSNGRRRKSKHYDTCAALERSGQPVLCESTNQST